MESVHDQYCRRRKWVDGEVINVRNFMNEYSNFLASEEFQETNLKDIVTPEELSEIEKEFAPDTMKCDTQECMELSNKINLPDGVNLKTLSIQKADLEKRAKERKYATSYSNSLKYPDYPPYKVVNLDLHKLDHVPIEVPEVVLIVQINYPERRVESHNVKRGRTPAFRVSEEFYVLGCQYLTELRDKIDCFADKVIPGECSDSPEFLPTTTCKDIFKSGFFYFHGIFYNDMRDKDCRDYSETIIKWSKDRGIGPFKKALMEETRFIDLNIQLGYPYVYVHQGSCEHIIIFSDIRLFSKHDVQNRNAYPLFTYIKPKGRLFCKACHKFTATWVVFNNKRLPEDPYFFCKRCYFSFNYDSAKEKIGEFRAYQYPDRSRFF